MTMITNSSSVPDPYRFIIKTHLFNRHKLINLRHPFF